MKALILAAGLGTRLRPITDHIPKPLVIIGNKPLLLYHLEAMKKYGVDEVLINTHYLPEKIEGFIDDYRRKFSRPGIKIVFEKELLGSAGTLKANREFFKNEENFLVIYGDNLTNFDYSKFFTFHKSKNSLVSIACYHEHYPEAKGIIEFDDEKVVKKFVEKPKKEEITSNYANAGIYILNKEIFNHLDLLDKQVLDFGKDAFPFLLANGVRMHAYEMDGFLLDIGTIENYNSAQEKIKNLIF